MDICEDCGALFLPARHELLLVEQEDRYGIWHQWLCARCVDDLAQAVYDGTTFVQRFALWGFQLPARAS